MNEMRKLMESVEHLDESWDVKGIAGIIFGEMMDEFSPVAKASQQSPEPFRAAIYEFGNRSGLYNPKTLDGSEIYHELVDEIERLGAEGLDEAYDEEVDEPVPHGNSEVMLRELIRELQKLERNTARVYREATQSKRRPDFAEMTLNELGETLTDITNLVEKYEDFV